MPAERRRVITAPFLVAQPSARNGSLRDSLTASAPMEPLATLDQVRQIDYESRRDRCVGLISPAATLFASRLDAKAAQSKGFGIYAPAVLIGAGLLLYYLLKGEGDGFWAFGMAAAAIGYLVYLSRELHRWLWVRRIRELDEQLSMMSAFWTGAGASREHFYGLQGLVQDGVIDFDSEEYQRWFHHFDKFLRIHCGLEYSGLDKPLHQFKKSA